MKLLLDTHAMLWWFTADPHLSPRAAGAIADEDNEIFVSAASAWEIATLQRLGRLTELPTLRNRFGELLAADDFTPLPIETHHALAAGGYGVTHRDPFDRMLAAQSELESLTLVTRDQAFAAFPIQTVW